MAAAERAVSAAGGFADDLAERVGRIDDPRVPLVLGHQRELAGVRAGELVRPVADRLGDRIHRVLLERKHRQLAAQLEHPAAHDAVPSG